LKKRFQKEYLVLLVHRKQSKSAKVDEIKVGEVVLVENHDNKRQMWSLGRVIKIFPDKRGVARLVAIRTSFGEFRRPIQRLYLLEIRDASVPPVFTNFTPTSLSCLVNVEKETRTRFGRRA